MLFVFAVLQDGAHTGTDINASVADAVVIAGTDGTFFNTVKVAEQAVVEGDFQRRFEDCIVSAEKFDAHSIVGFIRRHTISRGAGGLPFRPLLDERARR